MPAIIVLALLSLFSTYSFLLNAAGPITHAYLAEKWFAQCSNYTEEEKHSFILGTFFPDIRYLGVADRDETHEAGLSVNDFLQPQSPFSAGKKLHCLVDEMRERFVIEKDIYTYLKNIPQVPQDHLSSLLKLIEDEILYQESSWHLVSQGLANVDQEELALNIPSMSLEMWHKLLASYFRQPPTETLNKLSLLKMNFMDVPSYVVEIWSAMLPVLSKDEVFRQYTKEMVEHIEKSLQPCRLPRCNKNLFSKWESSEFECFLIRGHKIK